MTYYKFKNVKHSVVMELEYIDKNGNYHLSNKDWPTIHYVAKFEELEEFAYA